MSDSDDASRAGGVLRIDLDALAINWRAIVGRLAPGCRAAAVVKADAYGLGMARVAPVLAREGCRRFLVATLDEGMELRALLPDTGILVLSGPLPGTAALFVARGLIPILNSTEQAAEWEEAARRAGRRLDAALMVDTGMARLGLSAAEACRLAEDGAFRAAVAVELVLSHLACADEPDDPMNRLQLARFGAVRAKFPGIAGSLAASGGIFLGAEWHAEWVRPGAALYGLNPLFPQANPMAQVVRLQGRILQVRDVDAGQTVGYGATHRMAAPGRLAVIAAGYADGLPRSLGNRGGAIVGGIRVPLVGRVSMDLAIFDVSEAPPALVRPGALVDLIGPDNPVDAVAEEAGTIGYEILTALGRRYHRTYLGGGRP